MKRYLTGVIAVIIAIGAVAFTSPARNLTNVTFMYNAPSGTDYSQASVQNKANWSLGTPTCSADQDRACSLQVPSDKTTAGGTQLGSSVTITAAQGPDTGAYYVSGGNFVSNIVNKD